MKVAVSTDSGQVASHFGRCPEYTIAEVIGSKITKKTVIPNPGHEPGFLPRFLAEKGVKAIICGGMGPRAQKLFAEQGVEVWMGASGPVDAVLEEFSRGKLMRGISTCDHNAAGKHGPDNSCKGKENAER